MALEVIQRPEEDLYVEENPTAYDTPYFTSRWNAANLPLVYKISNTKFPLNSEDPIVSITSVSNNAGFAQLTHATTTYTFVSKGTVKVTGTTSYNGVWAIRQKIDATNIVIDAPFVANETGSVQNYYNNYNTLVKVYAGLPEYHPSNADKPMTLITDNPITVVPNASNIATVDVASLVKSKLSLDNDYDVNDLDQFTALFIEYAEQYDESDGTTVSVTTTLFTEDVIEGCDSGVANFVSNGDFTTALTDWANSGTGVDWVDGGGNAKTTLTVSNRDSKTLLQSDLGLTSGTEYDVSFDYSLAVGESFRLTVGLGFDIIYQNALSGNGTISFKNIFDGNPTGSFSQITFKLELLSTPVTSVSGSIDNVSITNSDAVTNPCLAYIFSTHSALQAQSKYGGNIGEYVQNFNGGQFANKWLTLMQKPVLFKGNYFDLSTIIPQSVIQSAVQSGGYFLEIVEYDVNGDVIAENQYPITSNLGDGIYRFRLDNKTFQDNTKEFTAQILRIPVNLFVDGDQGTFDTTSDPTGNPPSDWNLEKDSRAIINFEDTIVQSGTGALKFQSRSIFNDDYGFKRQANVPFDENESFSDGKSIEIPLSIIPNFDVTQDFKFTFEFYPTEFYSIGSQNIYNFIAVDKSIRIVTSSSNGNRVDLAITSGGNTSSIAHSQILQLNSINTIQLTFIQGASFSLTVNGVTITNNDGRTITTNFDSIIASKVNYGGTTNRAVRGVYKNTILESTNIKRYEFKFNQEQGSQVFESVTQSFFDILKGYTNTELKFDGGAWIDTTTL